MRLKELVDKIVADGYLTSDERKMLANAVTEDPELSTEERMQVARIVEMIEQGRLRVVDRTGSDA